MDASAAEDVPTQPTDPTPDQTIEVHQSGDPPEMAPEDIALDLKETSLSDPAQIISKPSDTEESVQDQDTNPIEPDVMMMEGMLDMKYSQSLEAGDGKDIDSGGHDDKEVEDKDNGTGSIQEANDDVEERGDDPEDSEEVDDDGDENMGDGDDDENMGGGDDDENMGDGDDDENMGDGDDDENMGGDDDENIGGGDTITSFYDRYEPDDDDNGECGPDLKGTAPVQNKLMGQTHKKVRGCGTGIFKLKPENVNHSLRLKDIRLNNFSGCYKLTRYHEHLNTLRDICKALGSKLSVLQLHNTNSILYGVSLCINDIRVCDGYGKNNTLAKRDALRTAFTFLRHKGLMLWDPLRVDSQFVRVKTVDELGSDQETFDKVMAPFVQEFISNPDLVQLQVKGFNNKKGWLRNALNAKAKKYKLQSDIENETFHMSKVNSLMHKLRVKGSDTEEKEESAECCQATVPTKQEAVNSGNTTATFTTVLNASWGHKVKRGNKDDKGSNDNKDNTVKKVKKNTDGKFDPQKVNPTLENMVPIKMDKFHSVITRSDQFISVIPKIAKACGVTHEFKFVGPLTGGPRWRTDLFINDVFIASGFGQNGKKAKNVCANNAINFMLSIGLNMKFDENINDEQVKVVMKEDLESASIRQQFTSFLEDKNLVKMIFQFVANQAEKELIEILCGKFLLTQIYDSKGLVALKKNSTMHKMELLPEPFAPGPAPIISHVTVTKEDLVTNPSVRDHIEKFVDNLSLSKLIFSGDLDVCQKELIEVLVDKHNLKHEIEDLGEIVIWKDPTKKTSLQTQQTMQPGPSELKVKPKRRLKRSRNRNRDRKERDAKYGLIEVKVDKRPRKADGNHIDGTLVQSNKINRQFHYQYPNTLVHSTRGMANRGAAITSPNPSFQSTSFNRTLNVSSAQNPRYQNPGYQSQWNDNQSWNSLEGQMASIQSSYNQHSTPNSYGASGYVPFETFGSSTPSLSQYSNQEYTKQYWDSPQPPPTWNSRGNLRGKNRRKGGRGNQR